MKTKNTAHKQHGINAANKTIVADDQSPSHSSVVITPFARNKSNVTNTQKNELSSDHIERHETYHPCSLSNAALLRDVRGECGGTTMPTPDDFDDDGFGGSTMVMPASSSFWSKTTKERTLLLERALKERI
tara:strand:- start:373 stop:765 length:393 start_codon:yes stop_codon:yes gene_type:complete